MQFQNIVFPVDFSDRSRAAAPFIHSMARRYGAAVHLIHVVPPFPPLNFDVGSAYSEAFDPAPAAAAANATLLEFAAEQFPHIETRCSMLDAEPAKAILEYTADNQGDLIAMPTHGYGLFRRTLLGSVTSQVLRDSPVPVWTDAHCCDPFHRAHPQPRTVVAAVRSAYDRADDDERTFRIALDIARDAGAVVVTLKVPEHAGNALARSAASGGLMVDEDEGNDESIEAMVRRAAVTQRADLVVIGRGPVHAGILDRIRSHAYAVICQSPCPVLSV